MFFDKDESFSLFKIYSFVVAVDLLVYIFVSDSQFKKEKEKAGWTWSLCNPAFNHQTVQIEHQFVHSSESMMAMELTTDSSQLTLSHIKSLPGKAGVWCGINRFKLALFGIQDFFSSFLFWSCYLSTSVATPVYKTNSIQGARLVSL